MRLSNCVLSALLAWQAASPLAAQTLPVSEGVQVVEEDSGEAWAMRFVGASTIMTSTGRLPELAPGQWAISAELGHIPRLSEAQQRVGLGGSKREDLNKSPVFGRGRVWIGLPAGLIGELGYTPPLRINGTRTEDLVAIALSRRWELADHIGLSVRVLGQQGRARGDITCPGDVVGQGATDNPFNCSRRSDDRIDLDYHGAESTFDMGQAPWSGHLTAGWLRYDPSVQVDAELTQYIERIQLRSSGTMRYVALGLAHDWQAHWRLAAEVLYVPLHVRRPEDFSRERDDFWSLRLAVRWTP